MFIFKGITSESQGVKDKEATHSILPSVTPKTIDIPSRHGGFDLGRVYGMREITVPIGIKGDSYENVREKVRSIASWLDSEDLQPLIFTDEPTIQYMARISESTDLEPLYFYGETTLTFLVPFPFGEDIDTTTVSVTSGSSIIYDGTQETFPIFTITTTSEMSDFELSNGEEKVKVVTSLPIGSVLVFDMKKGLVTLNGSVIQKAITIDSDFFSLKKGENTITFSSGANVSMEYKRIWL